MADPPSYPDSNGDPGDDRGVGLDRDSPPSAPPWVYAFGIIAIVLVLLFVVLHLTGNSPMGHGP